MLTLVVLSVLLQLSQISALIDIFKLTKRIEKAVVDKAASRAMKTLAKRGLEQVKSTKD